MMVIGLGSKNRKPNPIPHLCESCVGEGDVGKVFYICDSIGCGSRESIKQKYELNCYCVCW